MKTLKTAKKQLQSGLQQCSRCKVFYSISFFRSEPKTTVCLGCLRKAAREWNKSHLKTYRIYQKKWRIENRDRLNAQIHAKRLADPEGERAKMRAYSAVRRAKRRADRGTPICLKCGSARNVEMHHVDYNMGLKVIPFAKGATTCYIVPTEMGQTVCPGRLTVKTLDYINIALVIISGVLLTIFTFDIVACTFVDLIR